MQVERGTAKYKPQVTLRSGGKAVGVEEDNAASAHRWAANSYQEQGEVCGFKKESWQNREGSMKGYDTSGILWGMEATFPK